MRKVVLTTKEEFIYRHIKRYVDQGGNFNALCGILGTVLFVPKVER